MSNIKVSSDIDALLRKDTKEEAATFLGLEDTKAQWGQITGTLTTQTDLVSALALKANASDVSANTAQIALQDGYLYVNSSNIATNTEDIATNATAISGKADKSNTTFSGTTTVSKLVTGEIQCVAPDSNPDNASPIHYDATEHRFRDFDASPTNLMVIKKIRNKGGARVGINVPANQDPKCALHIAHGSSDGLVREALRVSGGAFLNEWVRIGHYTDSERDNNIANPTNGTIIYNEDHHEFQGYIGGGQGSDSRWQAFTMQNVAT